MRWRFELPGERSKRVARESFNALRGFAARLPPKQRAAYLTMLRRFRRANTEAAIAAEQRRELERREQRRRRLHPANAARANIWRASYNDVVEQLDLFAQKHPHCLNGQHWNAWRLSGEIETQVNDARARKGKRPLSRPTIRDKILAHPDFRK
jgi:hypothetical protein